MNLTTLEQSKLLKKWGAPQDTVYFYAYSNGHWEPLNYEQGLEFGYLEDEEHEVYAAYSLEELIGWLPKYFEDKEGEFVNVYQFSLSYAVSGNNWFAHYERYMHQPKYIVMGSTPLEAVFSLCKALHG